VCYLLTEVRLLMLRNLFHMNDVILSCAISFSSIYVLPLLSRSLLVQHIRGALWYLVPSNVPSRAQSHSWPALPLTVCPKYSLITGGTCTGLEQQPTDCLQTVRYGTRQRVCPEFRPAISLPSLSLFTAHTSLILIQSRLLAII